VKKLKRILSAAAGVMAPARTAVPGMVQAAGGLASAAGVYLLFGLGLTLLLTGVTAVAVGTLIERSRDGAR
jgi:hypothetical protein